MIKEETARSPFDDWRDLENSNYILHTQSFFSGILLTAKLDWMYQGPQGPDGNQWCHCTAVQHIL